MKRRLLSSASSRTIALVADLRVRIEKTYSDPVGPIRGRPSVLDEKA